MSEEQFFHGTRRGFGKGGYLFPVDFHGSEPRPGHQGDDSTAYAYVTTDKDMAEWYACQTKGRGRPKVLTVVPLGDLEVDPSSYDGERGHQYRSKDGFRVVKVEIISAWDEAGHWAQVQ